jgi:hypothetical protein
MAKQDTKDEAAMQAEMDELARRRAAAKDGNLDPDSPEGKLEAERERLAAEEAAATKDKEEADGQFALEVGDTGRKINLGTLIPRGVSVELKYKMGGKSIPNVKGGIMDPADTSAVALISHVVEGVHVKFTRDADLKIEKATVYVEIGARHVVNAHSEAGELLLRGDAEVAA